MNSFRKSICIPAILGIAVSTVATAADYYIATTGNDDNPGTIAEPFRTFEKARLTVRSALPTATEAINVWARGGTYYQNQPLEFGPDDSGTAATPVTYSAYADETVVLSGAILLSPSWNTYSGNIQVATIGSGLVFDMLFADHAPQVMARYPNYDPDVAILNGYASDAASSSRAALWSNPSTGFVRGLHGNRWGGNSFKITGLNGGGSPDLEWVGDNNRGSGLHSEYRMVENLFEELDAPGEWFYDEPLGKLYFYPPAGVDPATASFEAASLEELIRVVGTASQKVNHLTFTKLTFTHTHRTLFTRTYEPMNRSDWKLVRAGTIYIEDAENVTISNSIFDSVGGNAIFFSDYNRDHLVTNNEFIDNGATCVNICGSKATLWDTNEWDDYVTDEADITANEVGPKTDDYPKDITISYNHMVNMGRFEKQTAGVNLFLAESITIDHNTIHSSPRSGINICDGAWGGHVIEFNDVFDCIRETNDHGPFNSWGRDRFYSIGGYNHNGGSGATKRPYAFHEAWKTTHIRNNRFHYEEPTEFGIDLDDGSSNYEIYNNLILNTSIKLREGFSRKVYNNIVVNRGLDLHVWYAECRDQIYHNIIVNPEAYHPINVGGSDEEATTDYNLFYNGDDPVDVDHFNWTASDENSVTANPDFVDPGTLDFTVQEGSPALALGFVNFPMDQFGKPGSPEPGPVDFVQELPVNSDAEPLMGASASSIYDGSWQSALGSPDLNGVFLEVVQPSSYAANQGFEQWDVIRSVNGTDITDKQSFWLLYHRIEPEAEISATILRNQHTEPFTFTKPSVGEELNHTAGVVYTGDWSSQENDDSFNKDIQHTSTAGDSFELTFHGTGISFTSQNHTDMGLADVFIDGVLDETIDLRGTERLHQQTVYNRSGLDAGLHTLRVVNKEDKVLILDSFAIVPLRSISDLIATSASGSGDAPVVSNSDLAQTEYESSSGTSGDVESRHAELFNGATGNNDGDTGDSGEVRLSIGESFTINFDTSANSLGYDITRIASYFGWGTDGGGRSNQGYSIRFNYVDGSHELLEGSHWAPNSPAEYWTNVSFTNVNGGVIASGVKSLTFTITHGANANGVVIAREFDVFGLKTPTPTTGAYGVTSSTSDIAPTVSSTDLAQTQYSSSSGSGGNDVDAEHADLFNGMIGNEDGDTDDIGEVRMTSGNRFSLTFDTSTHSRGYDLTGIDTYFGWSSVGGGRSNQGYEIILTYWDDTTETLAGPEHWEPNTPASYWTKVSFTPGESGVMASGVKTVTFVITHNANAGGGVVIAREIDIFGVPTAANGYSDWLDLFPGLPDESFAGDPDHDGIKNLLEYVLNGDPQVSDVFGFPEMDTTGEFITFTFTRNVASATDTAQIFEYGSNLTDWNGLSITEPTATEVTLGPPSDGVQQVTVTIDKSVAEEGNLFARLRVVADSLVDLP